MICILTTGLAIKELFEDVPTKTASDKLAASHAAALRANSVAMCRTMQGLPLTQANSALLSELTKGILAYWKRDVQGYTAAHLAWAVVKANKATLAKTIMMAAAYDGVRAHSDAFASIYPPNAQGYAELLAESILNSSESVLQRHLRTKIASQKLEKWAGLVASDFAERIAEQAQLAEATITADATTRTASQTVAAMELVIAGLRADHSRLEQQVRQQGQQQQPRPAQRQSQGQRASTGSQVLGTPTYSGCRFVLANGQKCGSKDHYERNHPA